MMKILTGLFALILVAGLLAACQNPSAAPSTPDPDPDTTTTPDPDPDPDPEPMVADLDLSLRGWTGKIWSLTFYGANIGTDTDATFTISVSDGKIMAELTGTPPCGAVEVKDADISGLTFSFTVTDGTGCDLETLFAGTLFANSADDGVDADEGVDAGDTVTFEITLAAAPNTAPVESGGPMDQTIALSGEATATNVGSAGDDQKSVSLVGHTMFERRRAP